MFTKFKHLRPSGFFPSSYMFVFGVLKYTFEHIYKVHLKMTLRDIFYLAVFNFNFFQEIKLVIHQPNIPDKIVTGADSNRSGKLVYFCLLLPAARKILMILIFLL